ncbi:MAG: hypothetical protein IKI18_01725 [Prevotella sp.]|nr:hypothetical protein [Prevotella sp.]
MLALLAIATTAGAQGNSINGHEYVDLGLPSGLLWATCNVGATKPEDYGDYFAWGETTPKETYSWDNYKWCKGTLKTLIKYCGNSDYGNEGFTDGKTVLDPDDDAAAVNWKGGWRMPTNEDFQELLANTTNVWTTVNNVNGRKFTAKNGSGKSIFLPAAGYFDNGTLKKPSEGCLYWSSSGLSSDSYDAFYRNLTKSIVNGSQTYRCFGFSVRPVNENKTKIEAQCQPAEGGTVEGTGLYAVGSKATLTAKPNKGYKFVKWTTLSGAWQGAETTLTVNVNWTASGGSTWIAVFEKEATDPKTLAVTFTKATTLASELSNEDKLVLAAVLILAQKGKLDGYSVGIDPRDKGVVTLKKDKKTLFVSDNNKGITVPSGVTSADNINVTLTDDLRKALTTDLAQKLAGYDAIQIKFEVGTMGIGGVEADGLDKAAWYTLDGKKISGEPTRKGVYIYKGRKVVK